MTLDHRGRQTEGTKGKNVDRGVRPAVEITSAFPVVDRVRALENVSLTAGDFCFDIKPLQS